MISEFKLLDESYTVTPSYQNGKIHLEIEGELYAAEFLAPPGTPQTVQHTLRVNGQSYSVWLAYDGTDIFVHAGGRHWTVTPIDPLEQAAASSGASMDKVTAPMPGVVISLHAAPGDPVKKNDRLMVIESMKLETTIAAPREGVIEQVHFEQGSSFDKGAVLLTFQSESKEG